MRQRARIIVEPIGADLVGLAQAHALDASTFPHPSLPPIFGGDAPPAIFVARAEAGGRVVGFAATRARLGALEVIGLAVEPEHRRGGMGRALLRAAVRSAKARGLRRVTLHASTALAGAIALYESEGFEREALLRGFYSARRFPNGGNAWLMARKL